MGVRRVWLWFLGSLICAWLAISSGIIHVSITSAPILAQVSPTAQVTTGVTTVVGDPDMTISEVNAVLAKKGSPAQGLGSTLFTLSLDYHIRTSFVLGMGDEESSEGRLGVARVTRGIWNIQCSAGYQCVDGFRYYTSYEAAAGDFYRLIQELYIAHGRDAVETIIPVYAPAPKNHDPHTIGNDPQAYIHAVLQDMSAWTDRGGA